MKKSWIHALTPVRQAGRHEGSGTTLTAAKTRTYRKHVERILGSRNQNAIAVKLADIRDHAGITPKRSRRGSGTATTTLTRGSPTVSRKRGARSTRSTWNRHSASTSTSTEAETADTAGNTPVRPKAKKGRPRRGALKDAETSVRRGLSRGRRGTVRAGLEGIDPLGGDAVDHLAGLLAGIPLEERVEVEPERPRAPLPS